MAPEKELQQIYPAEQQFSSFSMCISSNYLMEMLWYVNQTNNQNMIQYFLKMTGLK